jgi:hypothetical protein
LLLVTVLVSVAACSSVATYPTPSEATAAPTSVSVAQATATQPAVMETSTPGPTMAPTAVMTGTGLPSGDLSDSQMSLILGESFSAYPWQMDYTVHNVSTGTTITGTMQAESATRVESTLNEPIESMPAIIDAIVISPTVYVKITGVPDVILEVIGLKANEWGEISAAQDTLGLTNLALAAANPADLLAGIGYENLLSQATPTATPFKLVGTEEVSGALANVYESQTTTAGGTTTFKVVVGVDNSRVYRMESQGPQQTTTTTVSYPASLDIQAPIP